VNIETIESISLELIQNSPQPKELNVNLKGKRLLEEIRARNANEQKTSNTL